MGDVKWQNAVPSQNPHVLTIRSYLVRFEQILCFSKIEGSLIP